MGMLSGFAMLFALSGGQIGLPFGLPPLAGDPVMANVAPEDCLVYYSWSGVAEPDPKSKNQTEQLLAEPEVQQFVSGLGRALGAAIRKGAPATPQGQVLGTHGPKLLHVLVSHPTALFATKIDLHGAGVVGGAVIATGDQTADVRTSFEEIEKVLMAGAAPAADAKWHQLPAAGGGERIEWGFRGNYLIIGIGAGSADAIAGRLHAKPPAWLTALKTKVPVERVSTVMYVNVKWIVIEGAPAPDESDVRRFVSAVLGLTNVTAVATVSGLDSTGYVSKTWMQTAKAPSGLFSIFGSEPLSAADIAPIPKDASFAMAGRLDPVRTYEVAMRQWKERFGFDFGQPADADVKQLEQALGVRFKEDIFDALGDSWCLYNSPGEGGLLVTGLTFVVPVKDANRLRKANERIVQFAGDRGLTAGPFVKPTTFRGQKIFILNSLGDPFFPFPFSIAWCVSDTHLIISLTPQNIRAFLSRDPKASSLADVPGVAEKLKSDKPVLLTYHDTAAVLKVVYPVLQMFAGSMSTSLQQEGLDVDASLLPSLSSIVRHVEPGVGTLTVESDGLVYVNRQSLPVGMTVPTVALWMEFAFAMRPAIFPAFELQAVRFQNVDGIQVRAIHVERLDRVPNR